MPRLFDALAARVRRIPGVLAVTAGSPPPLDRRGQAALRVDGRVADPAPVGSFRRVQPGYFRTLGIPLLEGRDFTDSDGSGEPVTVVSRGVARRFWPGGQAIGKRIKVGPAEREPWLRVVGVVGDVRNQTLEGGPDLADLRAACAAAVERALRHGPHRGGCPSDDRDGAASHSGSRAAGDVLGRRDDGRAYRGSGGHPPLLHHRRDDVRDGHGAAGRSVAVGSLAYAVASRAREISVRATLGVLPSISADS